MHNFNLWRNRFIHTIPLYDYFSKGYQIQVLPPSVDVALGPCEFRTEVLKGSYQGTTRNTQYTEKKFSPKNFHKNFLHQKCSETQPDLEIGQNRQKKNFLHQFIPCIFTFTIFPSLLAFLQPSIS